MGRPVLRVGEDTGRNLRRVWRVLRSVDWVLGCGVDAPRPKASAACARTLRFSQTVSLIVPSW